MLPVSATKLWNGGALVRRSPEGSCQLAAKYQENGRSFGSFRRILGGGRSPDESDVKPMKGLSPASSQASRRARQEKSASVVDTGPSRIL